MPDSPHACAASILSPSADAPGSLAEAIRAYELDSPDFAGLAASTRYEYRRLLLALAAELGRLPVSAFTPAAVSRLRALWARRGHRAANLRLQVLRNVLKPALISGELATDPFPLVGRVRRPGGLGEPHLVWSDAVFATVMTELLAERRWGLARAVAIARYVGTRRGDLVALPRSARQDGRFRYLSGKGGVRVDVPEDPALTHWLARTPDAPPTNRSSGPRGRGGVRPAPPATLVYNRSGRPYTGDGLGQELVKFVKRLHRAGRIDSERYNLHGLRHTCGVELALAGCNDAEGAAMMGHAHPHSFCHYRRQADRARLANTAAARLAALRAQAEEAASAPCGSARSDPNCRVS